MNAFWILVAFIIAQRLAELGVARRNELYLKAHGAVEVDSSGYRGYRFIVLLHVGFLTSLVAERLVLHTGLNPFWLPITSAFVLAQALRYWAIATLGRRWNTKILVLPGAALIRGGPYAYVSHPNYIAVVIEMAAIPLIFSCYYTAIVFSALNALALRRRIRIEMEALEKYSQAAKPKG